MSIAHLFAGEKPHPSRARSWRGHWQRGAFLCAARGLFSAQGWPRLVAVALQVAFLLLAPVVAAQDTDYWARTELPQTGVATFYAPGLMGEVQAYRAAQDQVAACAECVGAVALLRAGDIGRQVWLQPPGGDPAGPFLVVDCARRTDFAALVAQQWAVDVSFEVGQLWGMTRPLAGVLVFEDPAQADARPTRRPTAFFVPDGQIVISPPTATPAFAATGPTPWPTRLPYALAPALPAPARPTRPALPTLGPQPLTPIVTTPTPSAAAEEAGPTASPPPEIAFGRPGGALLQAAAEAAPGPAPSPNRPATRVAGHTATPRPAATPRADLTPILPVPQPAPEAVSPPSARASLLARLWRALWGGGER